MKLSVYCYANAALNGGDNYDNTFVDASRGARVAYDNTARQTSSSGEYRMLPVDDIEARNIAEDLLKKPPEPGYLTRKVRRSSRESRMVQYASTY